MNARVIEQVRGIFTEALHISVPSDTADLIDGGMLDSLALVELLVEIEQRFGRTIPLDTLDIDDLRTVTSIAEVIERSGGAEA